ncbi:hypothetical protein CAPTEDRAFT_175529 [Capitella teleta]|uniref:CS domain-containing protein n=1 Tax=Capitella teleta TaxID=283909 RepID=R7U054_CAPTE|nr:hypothetical protein CAPTEDRAFT_175529 [Capitella teleta]|eukprot:ELT99588.1 hypothetical protein CAPTEDRAFT_175529 [Capitella teleta]
MANRLTPPAIWAQRNDRVYITIQLGDCKNPSIKVEENRVHFSGKGGPDQADYELTIDLFGEVNPEESKYSVLPRNIPILLMRKESGPYWPRLTKEKTKVHWLKTDFAKWRDEDDSDAEAGGDDQNFEDETNLGDDYGMMKQMGSFNAGGGPGGMPGGGMGGMPPGMMGGMGGMPGGGMPPGMMGGMPGMGDFNPEAMRMDGEEDSDDEDLPDLE